ncbi:MAG: liaS10, partial [Frankiales bacterium]|nr:liaS10 [Frankiales bacterium]
MTRHDASWIQLVSTAAVILVGALTVQPRGWSGAGLATMALLIVNSLLLASRHVPPELVADRLRLGLLWSGALASAALVALATGGSPYLFAFFVAGHAGYRLATEQATVIAVACSVLNGGVLLLHLGPGYELTPWQVGAASGLSVLLGMSSRSRQEAFDAAVAAADSAALAAAAAERAAQAEAREAVLAERGRIARDVHDVLAHSLAGINMQLELADALLDAGQVAPARDAASRARSLAKEGLLESQRTVQALREDALPL